MPILTPSMAAPLAAYEHRIVSECLSSDAASDTGSHGLGVAQKAEIVEGVARGAELLLIGTAALEVAVQHGANTVGDLKSLPDSLLPVVKSLCGLDVESVGREHAQWLMTRGIPQRELPPDTPLTEIKELLDSAAQAVTSSRIVTVVSGWAAALNLREWGHRARTAAEALSAYRRRQALAASGRQFTLLAQLYAQGQVTVTQLAEALSVPVWDVVAELERLHHCRPPQTIELSDEERGLRLQRLRRERLAGLREHDGERVARCVVATQRIEQVDARRWVPKSES